MKLELKDTLEANPYGNKITVELHKPTTHSHNVSKSETGIESSTEQFDPKFENARISASC